MNAVCVSSDSLSGQAAPASHRPTWSGLLQLSLVGIPVKAYPAVCTTEAGHFHLLHADCGERIRYAKHCPVHGAVAAAAIVRGFAYAPGRHVVLAPAELDALRPARDRALRLECFLDPAQLDPALFSGRSLYLLPDGPASWSQLRSPDPDFYASLPLNGGSRQTLPGEISLQAFC